MSTPTPIDLPDGAKREELRLALAEGIAELDAGDSAETSVEALMAEVRAEAGLSTSMAVRGD